LFSLSEKTVFLGFFTQVVYKDAYDSPNFVEQRKNLFFSLGGVPQLLPRCLPVFDIRKDVFDLDPVV
jgi:hypothetical protein